MPKLPLPDVQKAAWVAPYKFSGIVPGRARGLMAATAVGGGILIGIAGYWGGWLAHWLASAGLVAAGWLMGTGMIGAGVGFATVVLIFLFIGGGYPALLGILAGSIVIWVAHKTHCRRVGVAIGFGMIAGLLAWGSLAVSGLLFGGAVRESSRILDTIDDIEKAPTWLLVAVVAIDALIIIIVTPLTARTLKETPYCETCGKWYATTRKTRVPLAQAAPIIDTLSTGVLSGVPLIHEDSDAANSIALEFRRCDCDTSSAMLTADAAWTEQSGKRTVKKTARWFRTMVPAALAREIEKVWFAESAAPTPVAGSAGTDASHGS